MIRNFRENLGLKLIALAVSIMIWFYVTAERNPNPTINRIIYAEITRTGTPQDDIIIRIHPEQLQVTVTGPKNEVDILADNDIKAEVPISIARIGMTQLRILHYIVPPNTPNVTVDGRRFVNVDIVPEQRKTLPVTVSYTSDLPFGSHYGAPIIEPQYADVVGSGQDLAMVNRLVIFVETHANNVSANLPIKPLNQDGVEVSQVHVEPDAAHVDLTLQETPVTKTLLISVPHKGVPAPGYQLTALVPNPAEVQVSGKPSQLIQLYGISTQEVSVDGLKTDTTETVPLALPPGITLKGSGGLVNVTLQISPIRKSAP